MYGDVAPRVPRPMEPNETCRWCEHCSKHTSSLLTGECGLDGKGVEPWGSCSSFELRSGSVDAFGIYRRA